MLPSAQTDLRTVEGAKRRRANTKKLRDENEKLLKEVKKLKNENAEMKKILSEQHLGITNTVDTTPALSPTKLFIGTVSPAAKRRAKRRLLDEKENLPRGSVSKLKNLEGDRRVFMSRQHQQTGTRQKKTASWKTNTIPVKPFINSSSTIRNRNWNYMPSFHIHALCS
ncbi:unnamed protein product [Adineta ricciae]|uniref:Uncharacterized protein n=1 Tax=Adineta ricciae TaxID=249248 RepID=A0A816GVB7_ADIRI|nr:unnamed protein product [Adineta ricciae]